MLAVVEVACLSCGRLGVLLEGSDDDFPFLDEPALEGDEGDEDGSAGGWVKPEDVVGPSAAVSCNAMFDT